jgi:hypothetical protein
MPGRQLVVCNAQAYSLAQRRRLLPRQIASGLLSARDCFLRNSAWCDQVYAAVLGGAPGAL